ncbi:hypothetical protein OST27_000166 [Escherichia coli]|nr:hypothetical protein [Escherichia coli]
MESLNSVVRTNIRMRTVFSNDDPVQKVIYLPVVDEPKKVVCQFRTLSCFVSS